MEMREESLLQPGVDGNDLILDPEQSVETVYETEEIVESEGDNTLDETPGYNTIDDVVEAARQLALRPIDEIGRDEVTRLKQHFYAFRNAQIEAEKQAYIEAGNAPETFVPSQCAVEEDFKALLNNIKEMKAARLAAIEAQREANLATKNDIIAQLLAMSEDADNVNREFPRFRELQQQYKEVGEVPATAVTDLWKRYQDAVERFYDQYRVNKDLRDYDFKKNLETKLLLCDEAEKLSADGTDIVVAFKRLQELHDKWRETGPVAKEMRQEIWNRFKDASAIINKNYQTFFEERKAREQHNEDSKTALCERVEALDYASLSSFKQWDEMTEAILAAQSEWKQLGYASKKMNNKLFARFRAACDRFFTAKAEYFRAAKDRLGDNLAQKIALCEQAEALKESTDWKKTADTLVELQKKWKSIGAVPKKQSDAVWKRFQDACDYFFEQKKKDLNDSRQAEQQALKAKKAIIASLKAIADDTDAATVAAAIKQADADWRSAGHVPFRDKDKVYDDYRATVAALQERFKLTRASRSMSRFETSLAEMTDSGKLSRERERLMRAFEARRSELMTCENNLGFFTSKSRQGNAMLQELERRIKDIKADIETLRSKIAMIDEKL